MVKRLRQKNIVVKGRTVAQYNFDLGGEFRTLKISPGKENTINKMSAMARLATKISWVFRCFLFKMTSNTKPFPKPPKTSEKTLKLT